METVETLFSSSNYSTTNISHNTQQTDYSKEHITLYVVYSLVLLFGAIGNAFVIYLFWSSKRRRQAGAAFVIALALTDLLSSILVPMYGFIMLVIQRTIFRTWSLGSFACYILPSLNAFFVTASAWLLTAISLERMR